MPTKLNPDGSPSVNRDPGDKDWEEKTARYDSRHSDQDSPYVTPEQAKELEDSVYGSDSQEEELAGREQAAAEYSPSDDNLDTREAIGDGSWTTEVETEAKTKSGGIFTKKRSLWALIALVVTSASIVMTAIITPAATLVGFKEALVTKFSKIQNSVIDKRSNRILAKKISKDITTGCTIKIKCRYKGMSSREIKKFNRRNAGEGWRIKSLGRSRTSPFRHKVELQKVSGTGDRVRVERVVEARQVKKVLRKDPSLQKSFRNFNKGKVTFWADTKARSLFKRLGVKLFKRSPGEGKGKTEEQRRAYRTNKEISSVETNGEGHGRSRAAGLGDAEKYVDGRADDLAAEANNPSKNVPPEPDITNPKQVEKTYGKTASALQRAGPGFVVDVINPVASVIYPYCITKTLTKATLNARKTLIAVQLIRYAINFARLADQIKAGDASASTTQEIGDMTRILTTKNSEGLTAFDSFGYNWAAFGKLPSRGPNEDITKYQTGGGPPGFLGKTVSAVTGIIPQGACDLANNFFVNFGLLAAQVGAAIATFGASTLETQAGAQAARQGMRAAVEFVAKTTIKKVTEDVAKNKLRSRFVREFLVLTGKISAAELFFHYAVPPMIGLLARAITGTTVTGNTHGPDAGNAAVSGFSAAAAASGQAHGLAFLNKSNAVKSTRSASVYEQHLAKIDGVNQFDVSEPNSFASKLAVAALPYTSKLSLSSLPTTLAGLSFSSLSGLGESPTIQAANDSAQFEICKDPIFQSLNIATGPFCNPVTGMDPDTIESDSTDPSKVTDYMYSNHYVDKDGAPLDGDYQKFLDTCVDSTDIITEGICKDPGDMNEPDKTKYLMFHYYTIDGGINDDMESDNNSGGGDSSSVPVSGSAQDLAQQLLDNPNVTYPYHDDAKGITVEDVLKSVVRTGEGTVDSADVDFTSAPVSTKLLGALVEYAKNHEIALNCLTNCDHSSTSNHYKGLAIDIGCSPALNVTAFNDIASRYGGKNNGEVCPGAHHYHYDFPSSN